MNLQEAKQKMKEKRQFIKMYKEERLIVTARINKLKDEIQSIKGAIFRGEIK